MLRWLKRKGFGSLVAIELSRLRGVARASRKRTAPSPFPRDLDELTSMQAWSVSALQTSGVIPRDASIEVFEVAPFATDLAFRSTLGLVTVAWAGADGRGSAQAVAKMAPAPDDLGEHAIYLLQKNHVKEAGFYAEIAPHTAIAPRVYSVGVDPPSGHFCVLMEYCSGRVAYPETRGCPPSEARLLAQRLAVFHASHWGLKSGRPEFLEKLPDLAIDWFAHRLRGPGRKILAAVAAHAWRHDLADHQTVLHGDVRVGNVLFAGPGIDTGLVLYDWQATRTGRGVFDLVYFMILCTDPDERRANWSDLLDLYHASLLASGVEGYGRDTLDDDALNAALLTLFFVTAPLLSKEASSTDKNRQGIASLAAIWRERALKALADLDPEWIAQWTGLAPAAVRAAFAAAIEGT